VIALLKDSGMYDKMLKAVNLNTAAEKAGIVKNATVGDVHVTSAPGKKSKKKKPVIDEDSAEPVYKSGF